MKYITKPTIALFMVLFSSISGVSAQDELRSIVANTMLTISIKGVPSTEQGSIDGPCLVSDNGYIYLPLLDNGIKASGYNSSQLARRIEAAYKSAEIFNNPRITVISTKDQAEQNLDGQFVHVGGYVGAKGPKPYKRDMTLFEVITASGGTGTFGSEKRVALYRNGKKHIYDLRKREHMNVKVYPGDNIIVPQKTIFGN